MKQTVKGMVEKGAIWFYVSLEKDDNVPWRKAHEGLRNHCYFKITGLLSALNLIEKCGECGGTTIIAGNLEEGEMDKEPCPHCYRGFVLVKAKGEDKPSSTFDASKVRIGGVKTCPKCKATRPAEFAQCPYCRTNVFKKGGRE